MILAYPVIGAAVMAATAVGGLLFFGYRRPVARSADNSIETGKAPHSSESADRPFVDGVVMRLTEAEAARLLAERAAHAARRPEKLAT
jgi:hypothetical protein